MLAKGETTNQVESLWAQVTKYSQGKWLNQNYSELWEVSVGLAVLNKSNPSGYIKQLFMDELGLEESNQQALFRERREHHRQRKRKIKQSASTQQTKRQQKIVKSKMGRKPKKEYKYKPEKVPPGQDVQLVVNTRNKTFRNCGNCGESGHTKSNCNRPSVCPNELLTENIWLVHDPNFRCHPRKLKFFAIS